REPVLWILNVNSRLIVDIETILVVKERRQFKPFVGYVRTETTEAFWIEASNYHRIGRIIHIGDGLTIFLVVKRIAIIRINTCISHEVNTVGTFTNPVDANSIHDLVVTIELKNLALVCCPVSIQADCPVAVLEYFILEREFNPPVCHSSHVGNDATYTIR